MSIKYRCIDKDKYPKPVPYKLAHEAYMLKEKHDNTCELISRINEAIVSAYKQFEGSTSICFDRHSVFVDTILDIFMDAGYDIKVDLSECAYGIKYSFVVSWIKEV